MSSQDIIASKSEVLNSFSCKKQNQWLSTSSFKTSFSTWLHRTSSHDNSSQDISPYIVMTAQLSSLRQDNGTSSVTQSADCYNSRPNNNVLLSLPVSSMETLSTQCRPSWLKNRTQRRAIIGLSAGLLPVSAVCYYTSRRLFHQSRAAITETRAIMFGPGSTGDRVRYWYRIRRL